MSHPIFLLLYHLKLYHSIFVIIKLSLLLKINSKVNTFFVIIASAYTNSIVLHIRMTRYNYKLYVTYLLVTIVATDSGRQQTMAEDIRVKMWITELSRLCTKKPRRESSGFRKCHDMLNVEKS